MVTKTLCLAFCSLWLLHLRSFHHEKEPHANCILFCFFAMYSFFFRILIKTLSQKPQKSSDEAMKSLHQWNSWTTITSRQYLYAGNIALHKSKHSQHICWQSPCMCCYAKYSTWRMSPHALLGKSSDTNAGQRICSRNSSTFDNTLEGSKRLR